MIQKEAFIFSLKNGGFNDFQGNPFEQVKVLSFRTDNCCPVEPEEVGRIGGFWKRGFIWLKRFRMSQPGKDFFQDEFSYITAGRSIVFRKGLDIKQEAGARFLNLQQYHLLNFIFRHE